MPPRKPAKKRKPAAPAPELVAVDDEISRLKSAIASTDEGIATHEVTIQGEKDAIRALKANQRAHEKALKDVEKRKAAVGG